MKTFTKEELKELTKVIKFSKDGVSTDGVYLGNFKKNESVLTRHDSIKEILNAIHPLTSKYIELDYTHGSGSFWYPNHEKLYLQLNYNGKDAYGQARRFYVQPAMGDFQLTKKHIEAIYEVCSSIERNQNIVNKSNNIKNWVQSKLDGLNVLSTEFVLSCNTTKIQLWHGGVRSNAAYIHNDGTITFECLSYRVSSSAEAKRVFDELIKIECLLTEAATSVKGALGHNFFVDWQQHLK